MYHCHICGRCIYRYDHHCPWINNCVGSHNIGRFTLFLSLLAFGLLEVLFCSVCLLIDQFGYRNHNHKVIKIYLYQPWLCLLAPLARLFVVTVLVLVPFPLLAAAIQQWSSLWRRLVVWRQPAAVARRNFVSALASLKDTSYCSSEIALAAACL